MATVIGMGASKKAQKIDGKEIEKLKAKLAKTEKENTELKAKLAKIEKSK